MRVFAVVSSVLLAGAVGLAWMPPNAVKALPLSNGHLPAVTVPADNPQTDAKVRLGRQLYFDARLSNDNTISCASCHKPDHGWADTGAVSEGVGHVKGGRNSPSVLNAAYSYLQFWDGRAVNLEKQAVGPIQNPVEMQMTMDMALGRLKGIPGYVSQFKDVFGTEPNEIGVAKAIAAFERTIVQPNTPYDSYLDGDRTAMSSAAARGMALFNGKGHCTTCHSGPYFSDGRFHNLGVAYADGKFKDEGRIAVTKEPKDLGAFKTPGLRGVAESAPYLHDGSEPTLEAVLDLYDRGGVPNPNLDRAMLPLRLTSDEKRDLVAFMKALSGPPLDMSKPDLPE
jgi:cytochrome c peroxidase